MAIVNMITQNENGVDCYRFSISRDRESVEISDATPQNDASDIFIEIPILEWVAVSKFIESEIASKLSK